MLDAAQRRRLHVHGRLVDRLVPKSRRMALLQKALELGVELGVGRFEKLTYHEMSCFEHC